MFVPMCVVCGSSRKNERKEGSVVKMMYDIRSGNDDLMDATVSDDDGFEWI